MFAKLTQIIRISLSLEQNPVCNVKMYRLGLKKERDDYRFVQYSDSFWENKVRENLLKKEVFTVS